jgi:ribonucleotide reductase beta subunit family protein with ferritin-like domain
MKEELEKILLPEKEKKKAICNLLLALVIAGLCFYGGFYMFYYHWAGL